MADYARIREKIQKVIAFSSRCTMAGIVGDEVMPEEYRSIRRACGVLAEAGLYPFDVNCTDEELEKQISGFMQMGLEESERMEGRSRKTGGESMKIWTPQPLLERRFVLGEGPCYDGETGELSWVDIKLGALMILDRESKLHEVQVGQYLGAAIPTVQGNFVALMTDGVYLMNRERLLKKLYSPEGLEMGMRFNDAKCDVRGRLWAGTMPLFKEPKPIGRLYRFDGENSQQTMVTEIGTSNGIAWSLDGRTMYYIDTNSRGVDAFDFDNDDGTISNRRRIITVDKGLPDGMTIDAEGKLWVALWGGGEVRRYDPSSGECIGKVIVPSKNTTSCCFGGDDLETLYITTSGEGFDDPDAGKVYFVNVGVKGTPTVKFDERYVQGKEV